MKKGIEVHKATNLYNVLWQNFTNNQLTTTPSKVFFDLDMAYQNYIKPEAYEITLFVYPGHQKL